MRGFKFFIIIGLVILLISSVFASRPQDDLNNRLTKLETYVNLKFQEHERALVLARESLARERETTALALTGKLETMNQFREQINKTEATYAKKDAVEERFSALERLIYTGVGFVLSIQFFIALFFKRERKNNKE